MDEGTAPAPAISPAISSEAPAPERPTLAEGADLLARLSAAVDRMHRATVEVVELAGQVKRGGVVEIVEGLPLDLFLALQHHLTSSERWMLLEADRLLAHMPTTKRLFAQGRLSWSQTRAILTSVRRLRVEDVTIIDQRIAASLDLIDKLAPDDLLDEVERAVQELCDPRPLERREQRAPNANFLAVQPSFDGAVRLYGELDAVAGATVLSALDAASDQPAKGADEPFEPGEARPRARQRAKGLERICAHWLGGDTTRRAKPLLVVHVDLAQVTASAAGMVELAAPGMLPTISARTLERLAIDADLKAVLFDGARPLAVSAKVKADDVPSDIRLAIRARDRGCRFPGSSHPASWADVHHLRERHPGDDVLGEGGDHHPENLVSLARRWHRLVHRREWKLRLDPRTGELTITRNGRTWRSLPRGTPLRWPDPPPPADPRLPF